MQPQNFTFEESSELQDVNVQLRVYNLQFWVEKGTVVRVWIVRYEFISQ